MDDQDLSSHRSGRKNKLSIKWLITVFLIFIFAFVIWQQNSLSGFTKDYQALFLSNGQVYFGKVIKNTKAEIILEDIYYLQVTRPLQQAQEGQEQANAQGELSLVKLGGELHGPTDAMHINRDQVLFIEDLKDESNVTRAIAKYKSDQTKPSEEKK